jgi:hypothetical protein
MNWVQQLGRLSRDPRTIGHSIIFTRTSKYREPNNLEEELIQQYTMLDGCCRAYINARYNDHIEQFCQPDDLLCDFCHGRALVLEETSCLVTLDNQKVAINEARLKEYIGFYQTQRVVCMMAYMDNFDQYWRHSKFDLDAGIVHPAGPKCPNWEKYESFLGKFGNWWGRWQYTKPNSCHYNCLLPSRFCHQWYPMHCINHLRQNLMCAGNSTVIPTFWRPGISQQYVDSTQVQTFCDFNCIRQFTWDRFNGALMVPRPKALICYSL